MSIPQSFIQDLLSRVDIVDVVGRHVQLKKAGANFSGLCPFHTEKSPSFTVSPTKQFYHCFGCGKNGNAIGFMMDYSGLHFVESIKDLAQSYGMVVPETEFSPEDKKAAFEHHALTIGWAVLEEALLAGPDRAGEGGPLIFDGEVPVLA